MPAISYYPGMNYNSIKYFIIFVITAFLCYPLIGYTQISFQPYQTISTGSRAQVVCINDINNDGLNDVVLGTGYSWLPQTDYKIFVYLQDSLGGLSNPVLYPYPNQAGGINTMTIDDVNNDFLNDIIIGAGDNIYIFYQNSSGTLNAPMSYYSGEHVYSLKTGDLNNDGLKDIAVSHWDTTLIKIFYQATVGFSQIELVKPQSGYDEIDVADINNDGLDDIVFMVGSYMGGIHVYTQNSSGSMNNFVSYFPTQVIFNMLHGIALGDLNNDGKNDVVASHGGNTPTSDLAIWYQDSVSSLLQSPPVLVPAYDIPEPIEISDLDCNNRNEIITVHGGWNKVSVYETG